jgi:hypothetical protein
MVTGNKSDFAPNLGIASTRPLAGLAFAALIVGAGVYVFSGYAAAKQTLTLFGTQYSLGEQEDHGEGEGGEEKEEGMRGSEAKESPAEEAREMSASNALAPNPKRRESEREKDDDDDDKKTPLLKP